MQPLIRPGALPSSHPPSDHTRGHIVVKGLGPRPCNHDAADALGSDPGLAHTCLTYALTPPNRTAPLERRHAIAAAQSTRIRALPIDALIVYDVQDEQVRNRAPRPFPFAPKVDPLTYAFEGLHVGDLPRIVYRSVSDQSPGSLLSWLRVLSACGGKTVLVGAPSGKLRPQLTLPEALALCRALVPQLEMGGVVIPERHLTTGTEDQRVWDKVQAGCQFFVSQTVWNVDAAKLLLQALKARAERLERPPPPILITLSPCGSLQTLAFLEWLGVNVPGEIRQQLNEAAHMLERSVALAEHIFEQLYAFGRERGLVVGCNVESVSSRAVEIDAAAELVYRIHAIQRRWNAVPSATDDVTAPTSRETFDSDHHHQRAEGC